MFCSFCQTRVQTISRSTLDASQVLSNSISISDSGGLDLSRLCNCYVPPPPMKLFGVSQNILEHSRTYQTIPYQTIPNQTIPLPITITLFHLPITSCLLPNTNCLLPIAHCQLLNDQKTSESPLNSHTSLTP